MFYVGHQTRLCHEAKAKDEIIDYLKANPGCVAVNCDFAMKVLPSSYRETMASWFGKKGIAWHGMSFVWWNPDKQCLDMYVGSQISEESKENGELVAQHIAQGLRDHRKIHPEHVTCIVGSDGAGAYSGLDLVARLPYMEAATGCRVVRVYTSEAGGGKCDLDRGFGTGKQQLKRTIAQYQGQRDVTDAQSLAFALQTVPITGIYPYLTHTSRPLHNNKPIEPKKTAAVTKAGLQSTSYKIIHYHENGEPNEIICYKQSQLGNVEDDGRIDISKLWKTGVPAVGGIIPTSTVDAGVQVTPGSVGDREGLQRKLTKEERREIREAKHTKRVTKEAQVSAIRAAEENAMEQAVAAAGYHKCTTVGCIREFSSLKRRDNHVATGKHQLNGNPHKRSSHAVVPDDKNTLAFTPLVYNLLEEATRTFNGVLVQQPNPRPIGDGVVGVTRLPFAWAKRKKLTHPKITDRFRQFMIWCYEYGEEIGHSKISPFTVRTLAKKHGTTEGHNCYPTDSYWNVGAGGSAMTFQPSEIIEDYRIKQFFSQYGTESKKQKKTNAVAKAALYRELTTAEFEEQLRQKFTVSSLSAHVDTIVHHLMLNGFGTSKMPSRWTQVAVNDIFVASKVPAYRGNTWKKEISDICKSIPATTLKEACDAAVNGDAENDMSSDMDDGDAAHELGEEAYNGDSEDDIDALEDPESDDEEPVSDDEEGNDGDDENE